jgi:host factor-I protein
MQSFFERRPPGLDTEQPSTRHLQDLIRRQTPVVIQVLGHSELEGTIQWQDRDYLALNPGEGRPLMLIRRSSASVIRPLV